MAVNLSGTISVGFNVTDQRTLVSGAAPQVGSITSLFSAAFSIVSGIAAGQCDKAWCDSRSVNASATDTLDFAGVVTDAFGAVVTFAKIRGIVIAAAAANVSVLTITRPASNGILLFGAISQTIAGLSAGGIFAWVDPQVGLSVTPATVDLLTVVNGAGGTAIYQIGVVGTSA